MGISVYFCYFFLQKLRLFERLLALLKKSPTKQEGSIVPFILVENYDSSVEKNQRPCGNAVESVGKFWGKDKN